MAYQTVELIGGKHGGQIVAVTLVGDGHLPERITVGEEPYVRFQETRCYFPVDDEGTAHGQPPLPPIALPSVRRSKFIPSTV